MKNEAVLTITALTANKLFIRSQIMLEKVIQRWNLSEK